MSFPSSGLVSSSRDDTVTRHDAPPKQPPPGVVLDKDGKPWVTFQVAKPLSLLLTRLLDVEPARRPPHGWR